MKSKTTSFNIWIAIAFSILLFSSAFADVPIQRAKSVSIQAKKDFPEFNFFLCRVPISSYYDKGRHYTKHYEKLDLKSIQISTDQPYIVSDTDTGDEIYLAAIAKNSASSDIGEIKNAVVKKLTSKEENGVLLFLIDTKTSKQSSEPSDEQIVFTIENIQVDKSNANQQIQGTSVEIVRKTEDAKSSWLPTVAAGFLLSAAVIVFGLIAFKKSKNK